MAQKKYLSNAGLEHYDEKIKEYIGDNTNYDIVALKEVSPAENTHSIGEYIVYNHIIYQVTDDIDINDLLIVDSNIEVAVLPEGTVVYSDDDDSVAFDYNALENKPQIAGTTLQGDKSLADLGIASEGAIEDVYAVMGEMGAKNLIPYPYDRINTTSYGVSFTDGGDGSVIVDSNGQASTGVPNMNIILYNGNRLYLKKGQYILSGCPSGGSSSTYELLVKDSSGTNLDERDYGNGAVINITSNGYYGIAIVVRKNVIVSNITFKPMLRLASDTDDTYQQYAKTNKQLTDEIANKVDKVAGKGLSTNDYDDTEKGKVADNTAAIEAIVNVNGCCNIAVHNFFNFTSGGVTFTVNPDSSVTASGPVTGNWQGESSTVLFLLKGGVTYKLTSGLPTTSGFFVQLRDENGIDLVNTYQQSEVTYTPQNDVNCKIAILIHAGYSLTTDETIYPMLYDARLNPTGYVPYSMTNRELTPSEEVISGLGRLIRIGKSRTLYVSSTPNSITSKQLSVSDRPQIAIAGIAVINDLQDKHVKIGKVSLQIDGTFGCYEAPEYNTGTALSEITSSSYWFISTLTWFVS